MSHKLDALASWRWIRLIPLTMLCALTACGGCDSDDEDPTPTPQEDMVIVDEGTEDMAPDDGPIEEDMAENMPDMNEPDLAPEDMAEPLPDGPEVKPLSFSMFPPIPLSCDKPGENSRYRIPVAVIAEELESGMRRPLRPYDRIAGRPLIINDTVNVGAISAERIRISQETGGSCTDSTDCSAGFVCATGGDRDATNVCLKQTGISFIPDSVQVDYDPGGTGKPQLISVLYENSGSLVGFSPQEVGKLFNSSGEKDLFKIDARATDASTSSRTAMEQFFIFLASYVDVENTSISAWWFAGDDSIETVPMTRVSSPDDHFTTNLEEPATLIENLPTPSARLGTSNVYQAILRVIDQDLGLDKFDDHEKFMFVVVDGPNEVWDKDATKEIVLQKLQEHNIHIFFIHFDSAIDSSLVRDPLAYWSGNARCRDDDDCAPTNPCATDNDCENFEECRAVTLYGEEAADPITETGLTYCLPSYREDGRLGPINTYADMACRTNGNYLYFTSPRELEPSLKKLPGALDGQWSYEAEISSLNTERLDQGFYRMSGVFLGLFGNSAIGEKLSTDIFEPCFDDPTTQCIKSPDNRPLVRLGSPE